MVGTVWAKAKAWQMPDSPGRSGFTWLCGLRAKPKPKDNGIHHCLISPRYCKEVKQGLSFTSYSWLPLPHTNRAQNFASWSWVVPQLSCTSKRRPGITTQRIHGKVYFDTMEFAVAWQHTEWWLMYLRFMALYAPWHFQNKAQNGGFCADTILDIGKWKHTVWSSMVA